MVAVQAQDGRSVDLPAAEPPIVHASSDDCEVSVAIGKDKLDWSATTPPKYALISESQEYSDEHKSNIGKLPPDRRYVADCSWNDFGVAPL